MAKFILSKHKYGFTLIELMIVVVIISVLAAIALPIYGKYVRKSRTSEAVSNLGAIALYEETFYSENDRYQTCPTNPTGAVPFPGDPGGRKSFSTSLTGWVSLGKVIPDGQRVYFQYEIRAGQYATGTAISAVISNPNLVDPASSYALASGGGCSVNTNLNFTANSLNIPIQAASNWFYATALGDQNGNGKCSLFVKVIDRTDIVIENEIE